MLRQVLIAVGKRLKGDVFTIDPDLPTSSILRLSLVRAFGALRGLIIRPFLAQGSSLPVFIGSGVKLRCKSRIELGKGVTLGQGVMIEGLSRNGVHIGKGTSIGAHSIIMPTSVMRNLGTGCRIGRNSGLGQYCFIGCGGGVTIGDNVIMGQYISFHTERHLSEKLDIPIMDQGVERTPIVIEDDVWVGVKATFLPGAHVGHGSIVAAGAVVRSEIPPYSIVGGVPARIIGSRKPDDGG